MILLLVSIAFMVPLSIWFVTDVRRSIRPGESPSDNGFNRVRPTNIEMVVKKYMRRDAFDRTSTITFLMEVDELEDPFAESQPKPPPCPSDAATSARPPSYLARGHDLCTMCDFPFYPRGAYGLCNLCGHQRQRLRLNQPRWTVVDQNGDEYGCFSSKSEAIEFAYERGDASHPLFIVDDQGKREHVAWRLPAFVDLIQPLDEPYPKQQGVNPF